MRFRIRTIMIAIAIVGLVTALAVQSWRAQRQRVARELFASDFAVAEARANLVELRAKAVLQQSSHVDHDQDTSQKLPTRQPSAAQ
jgi:type II secretory pathway pseudopilin PulG